MKKRCFKCNKLKKLEQFYKHPKMPDGTVNKCKNCNKKENILNRNKKRDFYLALDKERYRKNINRLLQTRYLGMVYRVNKKRGNSSSFKKQICTYDEFMNWAKQKEVLEKLQSLIKNWEKNNYIIKLSPSIDRIENSKGYTIENMQWITQQQNSSKH